MIPEFSGPFRPQVFETEVDRWARDGAREFKDQHGSPDGMHPADVGAAVASCVPPEVTSVTQVPGHEDLYVQVIDKILGRVMRECLSVEEEIGLSPEELSVISEFIRFCAENLDTGIPVVRLVFAGDDVPTTGLISRKHRGDGTVTVLAGGRHLVDVIRSIAHEMVHHSQIRHQADFGCHPEDGVGGPIEDVANVLAGRLVKRFLIDVPCTMKISDGPLGEARLRALIREAIELANLTARP